MRTVRDVSAGGVVVRQGPDGREVALVGRGRPVRWGLPKGGLEHGETIDRAAVREAQEETGLRVRLIAPVGDIQYWFATRGTRHHKTVHFFLMEAVGGDIQDHDWENDEVAWFAAAMAPTAMAFPNEAAIVRRALELWPSGGALPATSSPAGGGGADAAGALPARDGGRGWEDEGPLPRPRS